MTPESGAIARIVVGSLFLGFPGPLVRTWTGSDDPRLIPLGRAVGVRDLALGLGALRAVRHHAPARGWFEAAVVCDAIDAVTTLLAFARRPGLSRFLMFAGAATGASASYSAARWETPAR